MRNLQECQAEIFRRSEEKIRIRKRKNRALMTCIPSVLCLIAICAVLTPGLSPKKNTDSASDFALPESAAGCLPEYSQASLSDPIEKVTVFGPDFSQTYTDFSQVLSISDQLKTYTSSVKEELRGENVKENNFSEISDRAETEYAIFLITAEDKAVKYLFSGNTLKNLATNQVYTLSQQQVTELKDLLGISHP